jgi:hypothetical protein
MEQKTGMRSLYYAFLPELRGRNQALLPRFLLELDAQTDLPEMSPTAER